MKTKIFINTVVYVALVLFTGCSEFIEIEAPRTDLTRDNVFTTDDKANATMIDVYYQLHLSGFASGDQNSVSFLSALSADEAINRITSTPGYQQFNDNALQAGTDQVLTLWSDIYKIIYRCNAIIEGLEGTNNVTEGIKTRLLGEARFVRALCYFYLVNLFGDVPLAESTDYNINQQISRASRTDVYAFVLADLEVAQNVLPTDFTIYSGNRIRATRWAAAALLSRTHLFLGNWEKAESYATSIISNESLFSLVPLNQVFLKNNSETIFGVLPRFGNTQDWSVATLNCFLSTELLDAFEPDDNRKTQWVAGNLSSKYKSLNDNSDNSMLFRLAEQYFIRAEARAQLGNIEGALDDLNMIRSRAGLADAETISKSEVLDAILHERRVEFFLEWGHRWLDLKRTNRATEFLGNKPDWSESDLLYPIPEEQILNNPAMRDQQNPGY